MSARDLIKTQYMERVVANHRLRGVKENPYGLPGSDMEFEGGWQRG